MSSLNFLWADQLVCRSPWVSTDQMSQIISYTEEVNKWMHFLELWGNFQHSLSDQLWLRLEQDGHWYALSIPVYLVLILSINQAWAFAPISWQGATHEASDVGWRKSRKEGAPCEYNPSFHSKPLHALMDNLYTCPISQFTASDITRLMIDNLDHTNIWWCFTSSKHGTSIEIEKLLAQGQGLAPNSWRFVPWSQSEVRQKLYTVSFLPSLCTLSQVNINDKPSCG